MMNAALARFADREPCERRWAPSAPETVDPRGMMTADLDLAGNDVRIDRGRGELGVAKASRADSAGAARRKGHGDGARDAAGHEVVGGSKR